MAEATAKAQQGNGPTTEEPRFSVERFLEGRLKALGDLAGEMIDPRKLVKTAAIMAHGDGRLYAAARKNPERYFLALCKLTECGLEPDGVEAALIPYGDEIQAQPMYRGLVKLMYASGLVKDVSAFMVYANEVPGRFRVLAGTKPGIFHEPLLTDRGEPVAVYAVVRLRTGGTLFKVLSKEDVEKRRAFSQSWANEKTRQNSPWTKWPDEQWLKTALKNLAKTAPSSDRLKKAIALDNADTIEAEFTREAADEPEPPKPSTGADGLRATLAVLAAPTVKERIEPATAKETVPVRPTKEEAQARAQAAATRSAAPNKDPVRTAEPNKPEPAQAEPSDPEPVETVNDEPGYAEPPPTSDEEQRAFDAGWLK